MRYSNEIYHNVIDKNSYSQILINIDINIYHYQTLNLLCSPRQHHNSYNLHVHRRT